MLSTEFCLAFMTLHSMAPPTIPIFSPIASCASGSGQTKPCSISKVAHTFLSLWPGQCWALSLVSVSLPVSHMPKSYPSFKVGGNTTFSMKSSLIFSRPFPDQGGHNLLLHWLPQFFIIPILWHLRCSPVKSTWTAPPRPRLWKVRVHSSWTGPEDPSTCAC